MHGTLIASQMGQRLAALVSDLLMMIRIGFGLSLGFSPQCLKARCKKKMPLQHPGHSGNFDFL